MRSMKRAVVAIAAGGLLAAGGTVAGIVLTQGTARADGVSLCIAATATGSSCQLDDQTIPDPSQIYLQLESPSGTKDLNANVSWSVSCPSTATATTGSQDETIPGFVYIAQNINISSSQSCTVSAAVTVENFNSNAEDITMELDYDEGTGTGSATAPTPTPTASVPSGGVSGKINGYDSKCVDDSGNSSSNRATVISWSCNGGKAEVWRYAAGELIHNGLCLNDKGNAGNGGKLILYTCNGSDDELWVHQMNNTYELKAHNWSLCLTIPGGSKKNGVQLQADTCHNSADQHWAVP
jgi:hypothetical protein